MKKQKTTLIISLLAVALIISSSLSVASVIHHIHQREIFINHLYYSLADVEGELDEFDGHDAVLTDRLAEELVLLDKLCDMQRIYTNGAFAYENRGGFYILSTSLRDGAYSEFEVIRLHGMLENTLNKLCASSGKNENKHLTYKQVSAILAGLFHEAEELSRRSD